MTKAAIVECKARSVSFDCPEPISVLIETSWNVKKKLKTIMRICRRVLIETSWNVKYDIWIEKGYVRTVLIETSWNVKAGVTHNKNELHFVLIETSWNVKFTLRRDHVVSSKY